MCDQFLNVDFVFRTADSYIEQYQKEILLSCEVNETYILTSSEIASISEKNGSQIKFLGILKKVLKRECERTKN